MRKGYSKEDRKLYAQMKRKVDNLIEVLYDEYNFNDVPLSVLSKRYGLDKNIMRLAINAHTDTVIKVHRALLKENRGQQTIPRCELCGSIITKPI